MSEMTYERFERTDTDYKAKRVGLWPGIAGVTLEHEADVFCPECARDIMGEEHFLLLNDGNVYHEDYGNCAVVLSESEWDCPGANCGHCGIELDVRVIHYEGVCQPEYCPLE